MKALFMAPDLVVISHALAVSKDKEDFYKSIDAIANDNYEKNTEAILKNPANLKFSWVKFDKNEDNFEFFSNLSMLSANNSYSTTMKDVVMTQDSVFVNLNLLDAYKTVSGDTSDDEMDISLVGKTSKETLKDVTKDMFEETRFIELYSSDNGPQMFMLAGEFTSDTWSLLEKIGNVARRGYVFQGEDATEKIPGICLLFGLSMTTLAGIAQNADKMPKHIADDLNTFPRAEEEELDQEDKS